MALINERLQLIKKCSTILFRSMLTYFQLLYSRKNLSIKCFSAALAPAPAEANYM